MCALMSCERQPRYCQLSGPSDALFEIVFGGSQFPSGLPLEMRSTAFDGSQPVPIPGMAH
jgi:hypothetical protein